MRKILLLVDGSSYLYRAFHAMPDLRNPNGEPTGAIYGILNMLKKLRTNYSSNFGACIFDSRKTTFREKLFFFYKANRPSMPNDLANQLESVQQAIKMIGWPVFKVDGVEADDVIGSIAMLSKKFGFHTIISTCDKDFSQLVSNNSITVVNPINGEELTEDSVQSKYGIKSSQIVEYLMLTGDTSDNVPGVNRVGPITALKLLREFGSIEKIIDSIDNIHGILGKNLRLAIPFFSMTRKLLTIKCDVDLSEFLKHPKDLKFYPSNTKDLIEFYERQGFLKWLNELKTSVMQQENVVIPFEEKYSVIDNFGKLSSLKERLDNSDWVVCTAGIGCTGNSCLENKLINLFITIEPNETFYIPLENISCTGIKKIQKNKILSFLKPWLEDPLRKKVTFNSKKHIHAFMNAGIRFSGISEDVMLEAYILNLGTNNITLEKVAEKILGNVEAYKSKQKLAKITDFDKNFMEIKNYYSDLTFKLHLKLKFFRANKCTRNLKEIYELELNIANLLADVERNGVGIDSLILIEQSKKLEAKIRELKGKIFELTNTVFNINSSKELSNVLFQKMGFPILRKTSTGKPSTDEEILKKLSSSYILPSILLEYRGLSKIKSTYSDKLPSMINAITGRIHTSYSQVATVTGRLASANPNLQNIPIRSEEGRNVRKAFIARKGSLLFSADYSQIELRVMAHLSNDLNLKSAFSKGNDIHNSTASDIFEIPTSKVNADQRRFAKVINFGLIYGMGISKLSLTLKISRPEAKKYIEQYFSLYPGISAWIEKTKKSARENGYLETIFGRRLKILEIQGNLGSYRQVSAERSAINAPVQGSAADLIKIAMISIDRWLKEKKMQTHMIMQVHDELIFEVPKNELEKVRIKIPMLMCEVANLNVPLVVKTYVGKNWGNME